MENTEARQNRKLLTALAVYAVIFLGILLITNIGPFNRWLDSVFRLLRPVLIGLATAYLCNPFFRFFERKMFYKIHPHSLRRCISLIFTYLVVLLIIGVLLMLIIPQLMDSILNFIDNSQEFLKSTLSEINVLIARLNSYLPEKENGAGLIPFLHPEMIKESISHLLNTIHFDSQMLLDLFNTETIGSIFGFASNVVSFVTDLIFGLFISLYLLNTKEKRYAQIMRMRRALFSDTVNAHITKICTIADRSFGGYLKGVLFDSAMLGVLVYVIISIIGIPYAILIAAIVGITNVIPILGPFIGAIPSAIIILLTDPSMVIPFAICILVVQQIDGNILAPKILGDNTGVSSLCVMIAITTMGTLWGLVGMIVGVPLFATVLELTSDFLDRRLKQKGLSTDTEDYYTPELAGTKKEPERTVFARIQKKKLLRRSAHTDGGMGDLTTFERFRLDTLALAEKHDLFSDKSDEVLANFAAEETTLVNTAEEELVAEEEAAEAELSTEPAETSEADAADTVEMTDGLDHD